MEDWLFRGSQRPQELGVGGNLPQMLGLNRVATVGRIRGSGEGWPGWVGTAEDGREAAGNGMVGMLSGYKQYFY